MTACLIALGAGLIALACWAVDEWREADRRRARARFYAAVAAQSEEE